MSPIRNERLELRYPRLGYLSVGHQTVSAKGNVHPTKTDTIVAHAARREIVEPFAEFYGGEVRESPTSTEERERWFVITEARDMRVMIPGDLDTSFSQWFEAWASSGIVRRCDGVDCVLWRKPPEGDNKVGDLSDELRSCICAEEGFADDDKRRCKPTARLSVVPVDVAPDIPDIGVFVVRSTGFFTNAELKGDAELIRAVLGSVGGGVPLILSVELTPSRRGDMPKFRLRLGTSPRKALAIAAGIDRPMLVPAMADVEGEDAVGAYIDTPSAGAESEGNGAPDDSAPAPADELFGITVESIPTTPAGRGHPRSKPAQWTVIERLGADLGLDSDQIDLLLAARHGLVREDCSLVTAGAFDSWLREIIKQRAGAHA